MSKSLILSTEHTREEIEGRFRNKMARDRIFPKGMHQAQTVHDKINFRFMVKVENADSAMSCDWTCTSKYWLKAYDNLPKVEKNGPFNTNLVMKSIRPWR